jgi:hypothetical protein
MDTGGLSRIELCWHWALFHGVSLWLLDAIDFFKVLLDTAALYLEGPIRRVHVAETSSD